MKKIMMQFHATSSELVGYINSMRLESGWFVTTMVLRPFGLMEIGEPFSTNDILSDGDQRVVFTEAKPNLSVSSQNEFYDRNRGSVGVHIGRLTEEGLKESALAFMSGDQDKVAAAIAFVSRLKKITKAGAVAVSPVNGAEVKIPHHRYTEGAKSLCLQGVKILPIAGNSFYRLA